jgi:uncharacterized protein (TIGR03086 family)
VSLSPVESLRTSLDDTGRLITGVRAEQWTLPTPCTDWSVRDLVNHLITGNDLFARVVLGDSSGAVRTSTDVRPDQCADAYRESAEALLAAFASPGAMDRLVTVPFGTVPGVVALHLRLVEALVHGWDLARATGQPLRYDEEIAERALEFTRMKLADVPPDRSPFGVPRPVPDDAPALDRLAACLGRDPEG